MADVFGTYDGRFRSTAALYARFRLGYPVTLLRRVVEITMAKAGDPVLDLGCGPGLLALPLAAEGLSVTALDPEPEMLAELEIAAKQRFLSLDIRQGSSAAMPAIGPFRLAVMGRSFHWMERAETARMLDGMILPGGALVLFWDQTVKTAENRWRQILDAVSARYGADEASHRKARKDPASRSHESILLESPFCALETAGEIVTRRLTIDDILGFAATLSVTSPEALGDRAAAFAGELKEELLALEPSGRFTEVTEVRALIARRP